LPVKRPSLEIVPEPVPSITLQDTGSPVIGCPELSLTTALSFTEALGTVNTREGVISMLFGAF
jgi:hypothetical protein